MRAKLSDLCEIVGGGTPSRSNRKYWDNGTIPWVKISDFDCKYLKDTTEYITEDGLKNSSTKIIKKGSILYTIFATLGEVCILDIDATTNQAIAGITIKDNRVELEYLYYFLKSLKPYVNSIGRGVAQNNINISILRDFDIPLPSKERQIKRSQILKKTYAIITNRQQQIEELELLIKSRFSEMFGDPVLNNMGWEIVKLKTLTKMIRSGNTPKGGSQVYVDKGILFFRSQNVWKNRIELDDIAFIDEETHKSMPDSSLKHKDILMTKTGRINTKNSSLGRAALFMGEDDTANINGHVYLIRLNEKVVKEFVLFIITTIEYRDYIRSVCVGGIDKRQLNKNHLEDFPIIMPPIEKQEKFVALWKQVDKLKFSIQQSLDETQKLFDSLMQEYFG